MPINLSAHGVNSARTVLAACRELPDTRNQPWFAACCPGRGKLDDTKRDFVTDTSDDSFRIRPRPPKGNTGSRQRNFLSRLAMEMGKAGSRSPAITTSTGCADMKGWVIARLMDANLGSRARRVVIKTRIVLLNQRGSGLGSYSPPLHPPRGRRACRGTGPSLQRRFGCEICQGVRAARPWRSAPIPLHRFAPKTLTSSRTSGTFTRELMGRMERDLETRLDWVGVDHWDTDNPHTHVVLRGDDERATTW